MDFVQKNTETVDWEAKSGHAREALRHRLRKSRAGNLDSVLQLVHLVLI